jgi:hypothetical protein
VRRSTLSSLDALREEVIAQRGRTLAELIGRSLMRAAGIVARDPRFLLVPSAAAVLVWLNGLRHVDLAQMGDLGIVTLLPASALCALTLLGLCFCLALLSPNRPPWLLGVLLGTTIFLLYGLTAMIESEPRFAPVWRHAGFVDYLMRAGHLDSRIDVYFSWPGLFAALAFMSTVVGVHDVFQILAAANWAPVFFNLAYATVLYPLFSSLTRDDRVRWLALWFFFVSNWIAQDYLAPQAMAYLLYLVIVTLLVTGLRTAWPPAWLARYLPGGQAPVQITGRRRIVLIVAVLAAFLSAVVTHPLTPLFVIAATSLLTIFAGVRPRWLPLLLLGITVVWDVTMTRDYVANHPSIITDVFSSINSKVDANVSQRVVGSPEHLIVVRLRLILTACLGLLAMFGAWRTFRARYVSLPAALLAAAPLPVFMAQSYGGEMLLRILFFTLPFMSFFAACAFQSLPGSRLAELQAAALVLTAGVLLQAFLVTRLGNERQDYVSPLEAEAAVKFYELAPPGSQVVLISSAPTKYRDVEAHDYYDLSEKELRGPASITMTASLRARHRPALFLITRGEKAYVDMSMGVPIGTLDRLQATLDQSSDWHILYRNSEAEILFLPASTARN